ncbi:uncharacterized protein [Henckelia pumila]|uniref:uncharacterized protein isoform X4 n=1 Tax=Henckelia pumila TaxID=405737 RepID=UPI003C6DD4D2
MVERQLIFDRLDNKFIYPKTSVVKGEVERLAMRAIRERRCKMRRHWKQLNGLQNKDAPKRKPYNEEKFEKNTSNRFCRPLEGAHVSKTLVQHYHASANTATGELPSAIDTFEQFFHKGGQWKNDWAAQKHAEMVEVRSTQPEGEASDSTINNVHQPKDVDIMTQVLASRSRYVKGLGPLPKLSIVGGPRATNMNLKHNHGGEKIMAMQQMIDEQKQIIDEQQQTIGST